MEALSNSTLSLSLSHSVMDFGWRMLSASLRPFLRQTRYWSYRFCFAASRENGSNELRAADPEADGMLADNSFRICSSLEVEVVVVVVVVDVPEE